MPITVERDNKSVAAHVIELVSRNSEGVFRWVGPEKNILLANKSGIINSPRRGIDAGVRIEWAILHLLHYYATDDYHSSIARRAMPTFLSPIGYDIIRVTRPFLSECVRRGDRVVLLRPIRETDDQRATEAIEDVKRILAQIESEVEPDTVQLESSNVEQAVFT